jgi:hypothetical protein
MSARRKICRECRVEKSIRHFYRARRNRDGHMNACKACHKRICAERWALKGSIINEARRRRWRVDQEHRAKHAAANRLWQQTERGKRIMRESKRFWKKLHPEQYRQIQRNWHRKRVRRHEHHSSSAQ